MALGARTSRQAIKDSYTYIMPSNHTIKRAADRCTAALHHGLGLVALQGCQCLGHITEHSTMRSEQPLLRARRSATPVLCQLCPASLCQPAHVSAARGQPLWPGRPQPLPCHFMRQQRDGDTCMQHADSIYLSPDDLCRPLVVINVIECVYADQTYTSRNARAVRNERYVQHHLTPPGAHARHPQTASHVTTAAHPHQPTHSH
jgi:hypothetical protein